MWNRSRGLKNMTLVRIEKLIKTFGSNESQINALNDLTLAINQGDYVVFMGPSGAGKSTLLHIITGLERPTSGCVIIEDQILGNLPDSKLCDLRREKFGIILQFFNLHPHLTVTDNIELPLMIADVPKPQRNKKINQVLELVGISKRRNHYPDELSGGEQQRVAIARALVMNPKLLIADEPTGNLDSKNGQNIIDLLHVLHEAKQITVVQVTHDASIVRLGDRLIQMQDGVIISDQLIDNLDQIPFFNLFPVETM